jgi:hypothetical protein
MDEATGRRRARNAVKQRRQLQMTLGSRRSRSCVSSQMNSFLRLIDGRYFRNFDD